jgi:hypothetical protein
MSFLLEAIKRNLGKIFYSLVMAIILLFIFSVVAFIFFENQYTLADRQACNDVISCFMLHVDFGLLSPPEWIGAFTSINDLELQGFKWVLVVD